MEGSRTSATGWHRGGLQSGTPEGLFFYFLTLLCAFWFYARWFWPPIANLKPRLYLYQWHRLDLQPSATGWLVEADVKSRDLSKYWNNSSLVGNTYRLNNTFLGVRFLEFLEDYILTEVYIHPTVQKLSWCIRGKKCLDKVDTCITRRIPVGSTEKSISNHLFYFTSWFSWSFLSKHVFEGQEKHLKPGDI